MHTRRSSLASLSTHERSGARRLLLLFLLLPLSPGFTEPDPDPGAVRRLLKDPDPSARAAAVRRLAGLETPASLPVVYDVLADPHAYVRRAAAGVLGTAILAEVRRRIAEQVPRLKSPVARAEACRAYALWADDDGWAALRRAAADPVAGVRAEAVRWLGEDPAVQTTDLLSRALRDEDPQVRAEAVDALAQRSDGADPSALLTDADPRVRMAALDAVTQREGEPAVAGVLKGLGDPVWSLRVLAAERSSRLRDRRVLLPLARALRDDRRRVVDAAHTALVVITGIPFDPDPERWVQWVEGDGKKFDPALEAPRERPKTAFESGTRTVESARFLDLAITSKHVGFVIDASGSMAEPMAAPATGTRWDAVRQSLVGALARMEGGAVNVYCFSDAVEQVFPRAAAMGASRRAEVERWLAQRMPRGRTALYDGIAAALADPELDTVVVLSDGAPSAGAFFTKTDLLSEVRRANRRRRARIDVIAVGGDAIAARWRDVLERIATESGGVCVRR